MNNTAGAQTVFETQAPAGLLGMWFFILSEVMLFGAFLASYVTLRWSNADCALGTAAWPEAGHGIGLLLATLNTVILLTSSFTMVKAVRAARGRDVPSFSSHMKATLALGAVFLGIKAAEYALKIGHGYYPGNPEILEVKPGLNIFFSFYFLLTGFHALHVIIGMVWNALVLRAGTARPLTEGMALRTEYAGLYWHFVDMVWVFLFPLFYLV
jgi:heme/copper-type cytochrome/quinol oxidase subunit 3